jgi:hypothetical protein
MLILASSAVASAQELPQDALIGHWRLSADARDSSPNRLDGTNHGVEFIVKGPEGLAGGAAKFDGRRGFVEIPAAEPLKLGKGDFSVSLCLHTAAMLDDAPGDLVSQYDSARRRGFSLAIKHPTGVTTNQAASRQLHFGIDDGRIEPNWTDHGRPGQAVYIMSLAVHGRQLYAGTCEPGREQSGHVFRFDGGTKWIDCGSPDACNAVSSLAVHLGELYAGVSKYRLAGSAQAESENTRPGGKVFRYAGGSKWEACGQLPDTEAIGGLVEFRGRLYATSLYKPAGFFVYGGDRTWKSLPTPGGKRTESLAVFNGNIFAGSYDGGHVYRFDGETWTDCGQLGDNTQTYSFAIHEGRLFVGTWPSGRVYRFAKDNEWEDVGRLGEELEVMGMMVHNGKLFAGTLPLASVYRFDGLDRWTHIGRLDLTADVKYRRAWTMAEFQGRLFCGTLPSGHVLSIEAGRNVTWDDELPPGWRHVAAVRSAGKLELFVDGRLVGSSAAFERADYDLTNDQPLRIGFGPGDYFNGHLRDVRLYRRALTRDEIARLARPIAP